MTSQTTDSEGKTSFSNVINGDYDLTVTKTGYTTDTESITINNSDISKLINLNPSGYKCTFLITDNTTPVEGATVTMNDVTKTTSSSGECIFTGLENGTYTATISKTGYTTETTTVTIANADISVNIDFNYEERIRTLTTGINNLQNTVNNMDNDLGTAISSGG